MDMLMDKVGVLKEMKVLMETYCLSDGLMDNLGRSKEMKETSMIRAKTLNYVVVETFNCL